MERFVVLFHSVSMTPQTLEQKQNCWNFDFFFFIMIITASILNSGGYNLTNRFHVAVRLFSKRSQMTSKCGKNKKVAHEAQPSVSVMFLPHFDVLCDLLLNRRTATWNLFVLYNKKIKIHGKNALLFQISPL